MAKTKISEFDIDPANNTDINSINIAEGCAPSGINNAIRQLMSDLKEFQTGAGGDSITATGVYSDTIGEKTSAAGVTVDGVLLKDNAVTASGGFSGALNGAVGGTTPAAGAFTTLSASGAFSANGGATLGDASGDALTINSSAVSIPNGLNFDSNTLVIDATNNRVGVGTASPYNIVEATTNSGATVGIATSNNGAGILYGTLAFYSTNGSGAYKDYGGQIRSYSVGGIDQSDLRFYTSPNSGATERMRIDSSGYLLVGTTSASFGSSNRGVVEVNGTTDSIFGLKVNGSTAGYVYANATDLNVLSESTRNATFGTPSSGYTAFKTNNTERMRITSTGNVGIGTSSPSQRLDVQVTGTNNVALLKATNGGAARLWFSDFYTSSDTSVGIGSINANAFHVLTGGTERMRIDSSGNVGIGTSSPSTYGKFAVVGSAANTISATIDTTGWAFGRFGNTGGNLYVGMDTSAGTLTGTAYASTIFGDSARPLIFATNNSSKMTLDSSGNLGLGVTPSAWNTSFRSIDLQNGCSLSGYANGSWLTSNGFYNSGGTFVYKASSYASAYQQYQSQHLWYTAPSGTAGNAITFTQAMTLDASGNLGIGTTSPSTYSKFAVINTDYSFGTFGTTDGTDVTVNIGSNSVTQGGYLNTVTNHPLIFGTNSTERMRIDSSGNLMVGTTSVQNSARVSFFYDPGSSITPIVATMHGSSTGSSYATHLSFLNNSGTQVGYISANGSVTFYGTSSDYRLKENIAPMTGALDKVVQLKPVTYTWKSTGEADEGFIAHELAEVCPSAVIGEKDAVNEDGSIKPQGIDTSFLVATLAAAIKELKAEVDSLKAQLNK